MLSLNEQQIGQIRQQLMTERQELNKQLENDEHFGLRESLRDNTGELSMYDNHPADLGTELFEREKDISLLENVENHLNQVNLALEKMNAGTYGLCAECGKAIPFERLSAIPTTLYCYEHVPDRYASDRRPIEEAVLAPPFGRTSLDELSEQNQFDGEDAWQIVESWGTSNSPAMAEDNQVSDYNDMAIEADELDGYVEPFESFLATDIYGNHLTIIRNKAYRSYLDNNEGDPLLEPDHDSEDTQS
ncbi:TraR/DksA C4-type zinc finger protein [Paenibacillus lutrae]|uniref:Molecular chaperone DnaK n=1 Tax=Paenibacillus lutrae TaxID=2078573 RepID=A0A7X3JYP1_9BACL|nr:molecular chaperone DnaK [Paenibacillus lutrae]